MAEVLLLAKLGLQINAQIIGPEQLAFQEMLEDKYRKLMDMFQKRYAKSLSWSKLNANIEEREAKTRKKATELDRKLRNALS